MNFHMLCAPQAGDSPVNRGASRGQLLVVDRPLSDYSIGSAILGIEGRKAKRRKGGYGRKKRKRRSLLLTTPM